MARAVNMTVDVDVINICAYVDAVNTSGLTGGEAVGPLPCPPSHRFDDDRGETDEVVDVDPLVRTVEVAAQ